MPKIAPAFSAFPSAMMVTADGRPVTFMQHRPPNMLPTATPILFEFCSGLG